MFSKKMTTKLFIRQSASTFSPFMQSRFMASSLVQKLEESIEKIPMRDAVRYTCIKEGKWTASELKVNRKHLL